MLNPIPVYLSEVLAVWILVPAGTESAPSYLSTQRAVPVVILYISPKLCQLIICNSQFFLEMC